MEANDAAAQRDCVDSGTFEAGAGLFYGLGVIRRTGVVALVAACGVVVLIFAVMLTLLPRNSSAPMVGGLCSRAWEYGYLRAVTSCLP